MSELNNNKISDEALEHPQLQILAQRKDREGL